MNTTSIIALSVFLALFGMLTLIVAGILIWVILRATRRVDKFDTDVKTLAGSLSKTFATSVTDLSNALVLHRDKSIAIGEATGTILEDHRKKMDERIGRFDGDKLEAAVKMYQQSALRMERAASAFGELARMMLSEETLSEGIARAAGAGLTPDSYAPPSADGSYVTVTKTAAGDEGVLKQEAIDNTTEFEA